MEVSLCVLGEVEVDDNVDGLDVYASGEQIYRKEQRFVSSSARRFTSRWCCTEVGLTCAHQVSAQSISEVVEHTVPVFLQNRARV